MMTEMSDSISTFFFPLRTNVQYFATPGGFLSLEGRVKQALIMYDQVFFESGLYVATMGPNGAADMYYPATQLPTPEDLEALDKVRTQSTDFSFAVQTDPAKLFRPVFSSPVERQFRSSFHSLFDRLTVEFGVDGLDIVEVQLFRVDKHRAARLAAEYLKAEDAVLPEGSPLAQSHIVKSFFKDLVLISSLGCASCMDPIHALMLDHIVRRTVEFQAAPGFSALEFQVPHVAALPWEQIIEIRAHPVIGEFRRKLAVAEKTVRDMLPGAPESEIRLEVGKVLHRDLISEVAARMAPSGQKLAGNVVAQFFGGLVGDLIPLAGTIQTGYSIAKDVADSTQEHKSWLAVLMKLSKIN